MAVKQCVICNASFQALNSAITCSKACSKKRRNEWRPTRAVNPAKAQTRRIDVGGQRQCNSCRVFKSVSEFTRKRRTCKPCRNIAKQQSYHRHADRYMAAYRQRYESDISFRLRTRMRGALNDALRGRGKSMGTFALLGYSVDDLRRHLERTFKRGMSWANYGNEWEIDHILPLVLFDHSDLDQIRQCWALTNLRALRGDINSAKQDKREVLI